MFAPIKPINGARIVAAAGKRWLPEIVQELVFFIHVLFELGEELQHRQPDFAGHIVQPALGNHGVGVPQHVQQCDMFLLQFANQPGRRLVRVFRQQGREQVRIFGGKMILNLLLERVLNVGQLPVVLRRSDCLKQIVEGIRALDQNFVIRADAVLDGFPTL